MLRVVRQCGNLRQWIKIGPNKLFVFHKTDAQLPPRLSNSGLFFPCLLWFAVCEQGGHQVQANEQQWACEDHQLRQHNTTQARLWGASTRRWAQSVAVGRLGGGETKQRRCTCANYGKFTAEAFEVAVKSAESESSSGKELLKGA